MFNIQRKISVFFILINNNYRIAHFKKNETKEFPGDSLSHYDDFYFMILDLMR